MKLFNILTGYIILIEELEVFNTRILQTLIIR